MKSKLSLLVLAVFVVLTLNSCGEKKTKEELRTEKITDLLYNNGQKTVRVNLKYMLEDKLNDPNSLKLLETTYVDKGSTIVITQNFTAKNTFGGMLKKDIVVTIDTLGNIVKVNRWFE